jgi:hypothetical protein
MVKCGLLHHPLPPHPMHFLFVAGLAHLSAFPGKSRLKVGPGILAGLTTSPKSLWS